MKKKLFLHVGLHKTGTSSIQQQIVVNRDALAAHGWGMPGFLGRTDGAHHRWIRPIAENGTGIREFVRELKAQPQDRLLVSTETLSHLLLRTPGPLATALRRHFDTSVIIYLRRQDYLRESVFSQVVKTAYHGSIENENLYDFAFGRRLARLAGAFGQHGVLPRIYRDDRRFDAVEDFRALLDLPPDVVSASQGRANVSLPRRKLLLLADIPKKHLSPEEVKAILGAVTASTAIADDGIRYITSPERRAALVQAYAKGNAVVGSRFGLEASDIAFLTDTSVSTEAWAPAEPLSAAERTAAMAEIEAALAAVRARRGTPAATSSSASVDAA